MSENNLNEPTTGEIVRALRGFDEKRLKIAWTTVYCDEMIELGLYLKNASDRIEIQDRTIAELTASYPWVRIEGRDHFVQVKRFDPDNNMVVIADNKFGWNSVRYDQIREWRGLQPQDKK